MASVLVLGTSIFFIIKGHHLGFHEKRCAATWAQIFDNMGENWWSTANSVEVQYTAQGQ